MTKELRRKQVEEIFEENLEEINWATGEQAYDKDKIIEALLSLLSDAECKGAWAVVRAVEDSAQPRCAGENCSLSEKEHTHWGNHERGCSEKCQCRYKIAKVFARQVASSFGPDPEGK